MNDGLIIMLLSMIFYNTGDKSRADIWVTGAFLLNGILLVIGKWV